MTALAWLKLAYQVGPWVLIAALIAWVAVLRADVRADGLQITTQVATCNAAASEQIALVNAHANEKIKADDERADTATGQLMTERAAFQRLLNGVLSNSAAVNSEIDDLAAKPNGDAPMAPALQVEFPQ